MFRNRGELPNISTKRGANDSNRGYNVPHYSNYWNRRYIVIHYDKSFIAIEIISVLIIILTILAAAIFGYKISFEDPIANIKGIFLNMQLIAIGISIVATGLVTVLTKDSKENLIKNLRIIAFISIIMLTVILGAKLYMDNKYNEEVFGQFYEQYEKDYNNKKINKLNIAKEKELYIKENVNAYNNFSIKVIIYNFVQIIVSAIIFYLSCRLSSRERKKEKLKKDDAILFDEEQNIKL